MREHGFDYTSPSDMTWQERFARTLGQMNNALLGLLILPASDSIYMCAVFDTPVQWAAP